MKEETERRSKRMKGNNGRWKEITENERIHQNAGKSWLSVEWV